MSVVMFSVHACKVNTYREPYSALWALHKTGRVGDFSLQGAQCCSLCFTQEGESGRIYTYSEPYAAVCFTQEGGRGRLYTYREPYAAVCFTQGGGRGRLYTYREPYAAVCFTQEGGRGRLYITGISLLLFYTVMSISALEQYCAPCKVFPHRQQHRAPCKHKVTRSLLLV